MPALGPWELVIILLIVVVIFGAGRLAEIGGAVGKSVREFRSATHDEDKEKATAAATTALPVSTATPVNSTAPVNAAVPVATVAAPSTAATAAPAENKCPSCATVNPASQVFCGQCGTRLTRAA
jgi:sec-independent protein translocase protein TatA